MTPVADLQGEVAGPRFAGFWIRFAANALDSLVVLGMGLVGALVVGAIGILAGDRVAWALGGYSLVQVFGAWLYFATCESSAWQATVGKRAVRIVVTDTAGRRVSFLRATGRFWGKVLNALTLGIGWIVVGVHAQKRGLHDLVAGTFVVRTGSQPASAVVVAILCSIVLLPVALGIVAAIAVPGLLRARMSGNEAMAIGALRAINSAQYAYRTVCGGYASDLTALTRPARFLTEELTVARTVTRSGYNITLRTHPDAVAVADVPQDCEGAATDYIAEATPVTAGATGTRYFYTDESGTIYQDQSADFSGAQPLE